MRSRLAVMLLVVHLSTGCSFFGPRKQMISITSDPTGADVTMNGAPVGSTPTRFEVSRGEDLLIELRKPGYRTEFLTPSRKLSNLGFADTLIGYVLLVPLLGLLTPGAWEYETHRGVILYPLEDSD